MNTKVLEESRVYNTPHLWDALRLVREEDAIPQFRIEIIRTVRVIKPMELSFWQRLKWSFSKEAYPMEVSFECEFQPVFVINDIDPSDPYAENCAREVWDYLTKDYRTTI